MIHIRIIILIQNFRIFTNMCRYEFFFVQYNAYFSRHSFAVGSASL